MTVELELPRPEPRRDRYGRYLIVPADGGTPRPYTRATTWAKALDDQSSLINWSMRMCALGLTARKDLYAQVAACRPDDRNTLSKLVDQAKEAGGGSEGANIGSALHAFTERIDLGESVDVPDLWRPDVDAYTRAIAEHELTVRRDLIERVVVVEELGVAGTLDRVYVTSDGRLVIGDVKTGQTLDFNRLAISIQLALYARADTLYDLASETHSQMVDVDKMTALVVHLPSGQGRCEVHQVNIAIGWWYAQLAGQVRAARAHGRRTSGDCLFIRKTPTPTPSEVGVAAASRSQAGGSLHRDWIIARLDVIRGHPEAARAMTLTWPDGVPGLKTDHPHTEAELDQIASEIDVVEATFEIPFGDTDPRAPKPQWVEPVPVAQSTVLDEGMDIEPQYVSRVIEKIDALPEPVRKQLNVWAAQAHKAGRAFSIKTRPSLRRYRIYQACLELAEFNDPDMVTACVADVFPEPDWPDIVAWVATIFPETDWLDFPIGAVLGGLTIDQANRLAAVAKDVKRDTPALFYDAYGTPRWDFTTSNTTEKDDSTS